jgi:hypothetical protein
MTNKKLITHYSTFKINFDIVGKSIYSSTASIESSIIEIDTRKLSSGNYIIDISTSKGYQTKSKFNVYH